MRGEDSDNINTDLELVQKVQDTNYRVKASSASDIDPSEDYLSRNNENLSLIDDQTSATLPIKEEHSSELSGDEDNDWQDFRPIPNDFQTGEITKSESETQEVMENPKHVVDKPDVMTHQNVSKPISVVRDEVSIQVHQGVVSRMVCKSCHGNPSFEGSKEFFDHIALHEQFMAGKDENWMGCPHCQTKVRPECLRLHMRYVHTQHPSTGNARIICELCNGSPTFEYSQQLSAHLELHKKFAASLSDVSTDCLYCKHKVKKDYLKKHLKAVHGLDIKSGGYECKVCNKRYRQLREMLQHGNKCSTSESTSDRESLKHKSLAKIGILKKMSRQKKGQFLVNKDPVKEQENILAFDPK